MKTQLTDKQLQARFMKLLVSNIDDIEIVSKLHHIVNSFVKNSIAKKDCNNEFNGTNWSTCQNMYCFQLENLLEQELYKTELSVIEVKALQAARDRIKQFYLDTV